MISLLHTQNNQWHEWWYLLSIYDIYIGGIQLIENKHELVDDLGISRLLSQQFIHNLHLYNSNHNMLLTIQLVSHALDKSFILKYRLHYILFWASPFENEMTKTLGFQSPPKLIFSTRNRKEHWIIWRFEGQSMAFCVITLLFISKPNRHLIKNSSGTSIFSVLERILWVGIIQNIETVHDFPSYYFTDPESMSLIMC